MKIVDGNKSRAFSAYKDDLKHRKIYCYLTNHATGIRKVKRTFRKLLRNYGKKMIYTALKEDFA